MTPLSADHLSPQYFSNRVNDRLVAELLGLCKGIVADGSVNEREAIALNAWLHSHPAATAGFPGREIAARVNNVFAHGEIDEGERKELEAMLLDLVGEKSEAPGALNSSTLLPLDNPEPALTFAGMEFVFTGHFAFKRKDCAAKVIARNGIFADDVRRSTRYLVIGAVASEAWVTTAWGNKILHASDLRANGQQIAIVSEAHWLKALTTPF